MDTLRPPLARSGPPTASARVGSGARPRRGRGVGRAQYRAPVTIDLGEAAAIASALIAVPAAAFAFVQARHAKRSADTASEELALSRQRFDAEHPAVDWRIERDSRNGYRLINIGREDARGVTLRFDYPGAASLPTMADIPARGTSLVFVITRISQAIPPGHAWVTWDGHDEPVAVLVPVP